MLEIQTVSATVDPYVEKNTGIITSSKLKAFMKCPRSYKMVYVDKTPLERKLKKYFKMGTAFDDLIAYGEIKFLQKYLILKSGQNCLPDGALEVAIEKHETLVAELDERQKKLDAKLEENSALESEGKKPKATTAVQKSVESWIKKVDEAFEIVSETEARMKFIELTAVEGDLIAKLQREATRQTLFDIDGAWMYQKHFKATYKGKLTLGTTPDRVRIDGENPQIRELKVIDDVEKAWFKIQDLEYIKQVAFQQLLIELDTGKQLPVFFDILDKKEVPRYRMMQIPQQLLDDARNEIQRGLEFLLECEEKSYFPTHSELGLPDDGCQAYELCEGSIKTAPELYSA